MNAWKGHRGALRNVGDAGLSLTHVVIGEAGDVQQIIFTTLPELFRGWWDACDR